MTRFEQEFSGALGAFWQKEADKQIDRMNASIANGEIATTETGAAYWVSSGNFLPSDCAEVLTYTGYDFSIEATTAARKAQNAAFLDNYRKNHKITEEERIEAHAALGANTQIIDIITGERV